MIEWTKAVAGDRFAIRGNRLVKLPAIDWSKPLETDEENPRELVAEQVLAASPARPGNGQHWVYPLDGNSITDGHYFNNLGKVLCCTEQPFTIRNRVTPVEQPEAAPSVDVPPEVVQRMVDFVRHWSGDIAEAAEIVALLSEPPTPIDPDLFEARELVAEELETIGRIEVGQDTVSITDATGRIISTDDITATVAKIRAGRLDNAYAFVRTLKALKRGRELASA